MLAKKKSKKTSMITVEVFVHAPIEVVWASWTDPRHIVKWAFAQSDWEAPNAENDLRVGGKFKTRMQSKDGSQGFDFEGVYTAVEEHALIEYDMSDGRHVKATFTPEGEGVKIVQPFDPEHENPEEMQRAGWQAILDNFKKYTEGLA
ncbi:polyketide cyclase [Candidatus Parcubacteria bacterium]|nr:MAG: polyketide cyclase [Candidatus Parcubacteria bacterium]